MNFKSFCLLIIIPHSLYSADEIYKPIFFFIATNNKENVANAIRNGADVNEALHTGVTPLYQAVIGDQPDIVELLLEHGAKLDNDLSIGGTSIFKHALMLEDKTTLKVLLKYYPDINKQDEEGNTLLHTAIKIEKAFKRNSEENVKILLEYKPDINIRNKNGLTPLEMAKNGNNPNVTLLLDTIANQIFYHIQRQDKKGVADAIRNGADVNEARKNGLTPLHLAVRSNQPNIVELLLKHGAKINDDILVDGYYIFDYALRLEDKTILKLLLKYYPDINKQNQEGDTLLHTATKIEEVFKSNSEENVKILLERNPDINIRNKNGLTPLEIAENGNNPNITLLLDTIANQIFYHIQRQDKKGVADAIRNGADINKARKNGLTPLHLAVRSNQPNIVELLLKRGAQINDDILVDGYYIFDHALRLKDKTILKLLLKEYPDINKQNQEGDTLLHKAIKIEEIFKSNSEENVKILLERKPDINIRNKNGLTPLEMAINGNNSNVTLLLKQEPARLLKQQEEQESYEQEQEQLFEIEQSHQNEEQEPLLKQEESNEPVNSEKIRTCRTCGGGSNVLMDPLNMIWNYKKINAEYNKSIEPNRNLSIKDKVLLWFKTYYDLQKKR